MNYTFKRRRGPHSASQEDDAQMRSIGSLSDDELRELLAILLNEWRSRRVRRAATN